MRLLRRGKVKDIYELDGKTLVFKFSDRVSAFDVILPTPIPRKGEVLCRFAKFFFENLGVPHHMIEMNPPNSLLVKKLKIVPIEFVVRGYLYGSLYERVIRGEVKNLGIEPILAVKLPRPLLDPTTKSDVKDVPITREEILSSSIIDEERLRYMESTSITIYEKISRLADKAGFILADLKLEYGIDESGRVLLADSIGPDEFRLWPAETYFPGKPQESYDKQIVRDWLIKTGYKSRLDDARSKGLPPPPPPELPREIVELTSMRYIEAYERLTGEKFG